jgi:hypothetical protein
MNRRRLMTTCILLAASAAVWVGGGEPRREDERIRIIRVVPTEVERAYVARLKSDPPKHRGFLYDPAAQPYGKRRASENQEFGGAAKLVAERLARDGLPSTLVAAMDRLGPELFSTGSTESLAALQSIGLPVDWLRFFRFPDDPAGDAGALVARLSRRLAGGATRAEVEAEAAALTFSFRPTHAGFRLAAESGNHRIGLLRLQLPTIDFWRGPGDGSAADVTRQLYDALGGAELLVCVPSPSADGFAGLARSWRSAGGPAVTVMSGDWTPQQWAQDNGKPGWIAARDGHDAGLATLLPRYANRGEERSAFDLDETMIAYSLSAAGLSPVRSPLLFQGGNLMVAEHPTTGRRTLLVGEAEVYRNTALGLGAGQVVEAFRIECGADACAVLPAVSFHIDVDVCVRAHEGGLIAFVNDELAAARSILASSVPALVGAGAMSAAAARDLAAHLDAHQIDAVLETLSPALAAARSPDGAYPLAFADQFARGATDSGPANLQRVLLAMDILASRHITPDEMPGDPATAAFIAAFQRRAADRDAQRRILEGLGWRVAPIPSTSDETISVNYVNGIHEPGRYLMPAYGGLFAPVDEAAKRAFEAALGPGVEIVPIHCAETQRRLGALHCAASAYYSPTRSR